MKLHNVLLLAAVALAACAPGDGPTDPAISPSFAGTGGGAQTGELYLCKYTQDPTATLFDFEVTASGGKVPGNGKFTLSSTQEVYSVTSPCVVVWTATDESDVTVTITENLDPGWELFRIWWSQVGLIEPVQNPLEITVNAAGGHVTFKNRPAPIDMAPGRMTGGGGQFTVGGVHVTRGFTIHCDITLSNNVEINWDEHRWHLDKPLTSALCIDDPDVEPAPPPAPFDTFVGEGFGRLNNVDGSFLRFTFVDSGEPGGKADRATIQVWAPGADPETELPMLSVDGLLDHGNLQAHYDQPHK